MTATARPSVSKPREPERTGVLAERGLRAEDTRACPAALGTPIRSGRCNGTGLAVRDDPSPGLGTPIQPGRCNGVERCWVSAASVLLGNTDPAGEV